MNVPALEKRVDNHAIKLISMENRTVLMVNDVELAVTNYKIESSMRDGIELTVTLKLEEPLFTEWSSTTRAKPQ